MARFRSSGQYVKQGGDICFRITLKTAARKLVQTYKYTRIEYKTRFSFSSFFYMFFSFLGKHIWREVGFDSILKEN